MSGDEPCKVFYNFSNASDLHTSANVDAVPPFNGPLPGTRSYAGVYMASGNIQTGANVTIQNNTIVKFLGQEIILAAGFTAQQGSDFLARIQPCIRGCDAGVGRYSSIADDEKEFFTLSDGKTHTNDDKETQELSNNNNNIISYEVTIHPNPANEKLQIQIGNKEGLSKIMVYNAIGQLVYEEAINQKNELLLIT